MILYDVKNFIALLTLISVLQASNNEFFDERPQLYTQAQFDTVALQPAGTLTLSAELVMPTNDTGTITPASGGGLYFPAGTVRFTNGNIFSRSEILP